MAAMWRLKSRAVKNVSLASYRGKLRAALAFDAWEDDPKVEGDEVPHGWVFLPVADGLFHATLRDTNDVELIGNGMATTCRGDGLFWGMTGSKRSAIFQANHMDLSRIPRSKIRPPTVSRQVAVEPEWLKVPHR